MPKVDDHIRRAQEEGKFEDLPGKGEPLHLDENPLEDPEWRLANHLLRSSGYTLPWIEARREIQAEIEAARADLRRAWDWRQTDHSSDHSISQVQAEWQRAIEAFRQRIIQVNRRIFDYNLKAPSSRFQLLKIDHEKEIQSIIS